jgi:hypothetical protein
MVAWWFQKLQGGGTQDGTRHSERQRNGSRLFTGGRRGNRDESLQNSVPSVTSCSHLRANGTPGRDALFHREKPGECGPHPTRLSSTLKLGSTELATRLSSPKSEVRPEGSSPKSGLPHPRRTGEGERRGRDTNPGTGHFHRRGLGPSHCFLGVPDDDDALSGARRLATRARATEVSRSRA